MEERQKGQMTVQEAGRKGGRRVHELYSPDHFLALSRLGGQEVVKKLGEGHLRQIAKKGGETTRDRYGVDLYIDNGRQGGIVSAQRRAAIGQGRRRFSLYDPVRVNQARAILEGLGKTLADTVPLPLTTDDEFESYKSGDQEGVQRFNDRMILYCSLLARNYYDLPLESILLRVERLVDSDFVRESASSDSVPLLQKRPLRQALTLGVFRMKQRSSKVREIEKNIDPNTIILKGFFQANPPDSPRAKKLLSILTRKQKEVFEVSFLQMKPVDNLAANLHISRRTMLNHFSLAQKKLLQCIYQKEESWPVPLINLAKTDFESEFDQLLRTLPTKYQYFTILHIDEGLTSSEISEVLGISSGSVRMMGTMLRSRIKQEYPRWVAQKATKIQGQSG